MDDKHYFTPGQDIRASSSKAKSALLEIKIPGLVVASRTTWIDRPPMPSTLDILFIVDTLMFGSGTGQPFTDPAQPADPCLGSFAITGLATASVAMHSGQGLLWSANALVSDFRGQNITGVCPGGFSATFEFNEGNKAFSWSFDPSPGISIAALTASPYPLAELMLGFTNFAGDARISGDWGTLVIATSNNVTVTAVQGQPQPPGNLRVG